MNVSFPEVLRGYFNELPSPVKVIIYSGVSGLLAALVTDLGVLDTIYSKYLVIALAVPINLIAYLILNEKK